MVLQFAVRGAAPLLLQGHHGANGRVHLDQSTRIDDLLTYEEKPKNNDAFKLPITYVFREFDAFDRYVKGGRIFVSGILSPPLHHLNGSRSSLRPQWREEELQAKLTVDIQVTVCAVQLKYERKKMVLVFRKETFVNRFTHIRVKDPP